MSWAGLDRAAADHVVDIDSRRQLHRQLLAGNIRAQRRKPDGTVEPIDPEDWRGVIDWDLRIVSAPGLEPSKIEWHEVEINLDDLARCLRSG